MSGKGAAKEKAKWRFMQKYYHKGVFYMDDDTLGKEGGGKPGAGAGVDEVDVRKRSYDAPTLEDKFDRAALPKVMVMRVERRGEMR